MNNNSERKDIRDLNDYIDFGSETFGAGGKAVNLNAGIGNGLVWFIGMTLDDRMISKQKQG